MTTGVEITDCCIKEASERLGELIRLFGTNDQVSIRRLYNVTAHLTKADSAVDMTWQTNSAMQHRYA
jgi:hypothetical protein